MEPVSLSGFALKAALTGFPHVIRKIQAVRWEKAQTIYLKRMRRGDLHAGIEDKEAYRAWQYFRAAADGAAYRNLELIAQAINSEILEPTLIDEEMKRITDSLATITREEAIVLGAVARQLRLAQTGKLDRDAIWHEVLNSLIGTPVFPLDGDDIAACGQALGRTGWLRSAYMGFVPTRRFEIVARMVDFNDPDVVAP